MKKKAFCYQEQKPYLIHLNAKLCPICQNEPVILESEKDLAEEKIKKFKEKWKVKKCPYCHKEIPQFKNGKRVLFSSFKKKTFCNRECADNFKSDKLKLEREKMKTRFCQVCGKAIPKNVGKSIYKHRAVCFNKECVKKFATIRAPQYRMDFKKEKKSILEKFSDIDTKYDS